MLSWIEYIIQSIGYAGIALLMFLENIFPPIPSEIIMPFAGFLSGKGQLSFIGVVIAGAVGSIPAGINRMNLMSFFCCLWLVPLSG